MLITYLAKVQSTAESEKKLINFGGKVIFLLALIFREAIQIEEGFIIEGSVDKPVGWDNN